MSEEKNIGVLVSTLHDKEALERAISRFHGIPCTVDIISSDMDENGGYAELSVGYRIAEAPECKPLRLEEFEKIALIRRNCGQPAAKAEKRVEPWQQNRRTPWRKRR
ncbi:hypothetical protein HWC07_gp014 [Pantoea phage vB_PagM_LIET2]|uniref:Uncharacterized protein n=1 Tax=Pantoea phage vB_PagM_LIET2 TaxID=2508071 RepID=A0A411AW01_9CAUD|nr:hypothetical protein HWC07_gp014 [Pantoea phage vB_PagM_LIET2]QAX92266.1 hypothetical protein LIET2_gp014 [Pantoea phage vB_PagM_LIET2]